MRIVENNISIKELKEMASKMFGDLVKAVVDVQEGILVVMQNYTQMRRHIYFN